MNPTDGNYSLRVQRTQVVTSDLKAREGFLRTEVMTRIWEDELVFFSTGELCVKMRKYKLGADGQTGVNKVGFVSNRVKN